jgi:hypothetical protein
MDSSVMARQWSAQRLGNEAQDGLALDGSAMNGSALELALDRTAQQWRDGRLALGNESDGSRWTARRRRNERLGDGVLKGSVVEHWWTACRWMA